MRAIGIAAGFVIVVGSAAAQVGPVDRGVVCGVDGTLTYAGEGEPVDEDYDYVDALRDGSPVGDPLDRPPRQSIATLIDATVSGCRWLDGEELDECFPASGDVRWTIEGLTVTETACASRTFKGAFQTVDAEGRPLIGDDDRPACRGDFFCGHSASEIAIDVAKVVPGISDPGSVGAEANDGRGESPPGGEQCTLELVFGRDGAELASRRFGLATLHFTDGAAVDLERACADAAGRPAAAPFTGVVGSSSL